MSKQSSIDWLISCVTEDQMVKSKSLNEWLEIFEQAKTIHKNEVEDAYAHGQNNGYMYANQKAITISKENYFIQTFKQNN
jgi:hypothetical protein